MNLLNAVETINFLLEVVKMQIVSGLNIPAQGHLQIRHFICHLYYHALVEILDTDQALYMPLGPPCTGRNTIYRSGTLYRIE
jgi:hypothetical protein